MQVERMIFIRLNRPMVNEAHELDAANAPVRARAAKAAQALEAAQEERSNMVDLAKEISRSVSMRDNYP